jgi:hypothetical protein
MDDGFNENPGTEFFVEKLSPLEAPPLGCLAMLLGC